MAQRHDSTHIFHSYSERNISINVVGASLKHFLSYVATLLCALPLLISNTLDRVMSKLDEHDNAT